MSPRLFWKLFLIFSALQLATVIAFVVLVSKWQAQQTYAQKEKRLSDAASIVRGHVGVDFESDNRDEHQQLVDQLVEETGMRVTLVKTNGVVLADSEKAAELMENHKERAELALAATKGAGSSQRFSNTVNMSMLYYAARIENSVGVPKGYVRCLLYTSDAADE